MKKHAFFYRLLRPLVILFAKIRFGYRYEKARDLPENYIVLSNHTTDYDLLFVAASFPRMMYFVGSEHISRWGILYKFLKFCFNPIMRPKGASAASTVKEMMRRAKSGANLCLFAEGVRSWDGTPSPIAPSTAKMVQRMDCGLVTYRITGGYFASPMWSGSGVRRGKVHAAPMHVFTAEELQAMTADKLYKIIVADLGEDAYERQLAAPEKYPCKEPAKGLENLLFICPECGGVDTFSSAGSTVTCKSCEHTFTLDEYGMIHGGKFTTVKDLALWQKEQVSHHAEQDAVYTAPSGILSTVRNHVESVVTEGPVTLDKTALCCGELEFSLDSMSDLAMHGQHHLVFTAGKDYFELAIPAGTNALKFMLLYKSLKTVKQKGCCDRYGLFRCQYHPLEPHHSVRYSRRSDPCGQFPAPSDPLRAQQPDAHRCAGRLHPADFAQSRNSAH